MRYSLLLPLIFLALSGCFGPGPDPTTTYVTPARTTTYVTPTTTYVTPATTYVTPTATTTVTRTQYTP